MDYIMIFIAGCDGEEALRHYDPFQPYLEILLIELFRKNYIRSYVKFEMQSIYAVLFI